MRRRPPRLSRRAIVTIAVVATAVIALATPGMVWAHARLTRSDPTAKASLSVAPTRIRLWFSEAPEIAMSRVTLTDSSGVSISLGKLERGDDKLLVEASIGRALIAGRYTVTWRVAAADGHPSSGSFTFTVTPRSPAAKETAKAPPGVSEGSITTGARSTPTTVEQSLHRETDDASGWGQVAARAVAYGAILVVVGGVVFALLILPRATKVSDDARVIALGGTARVVIVAAIVLLLSAAVRLLLQSAMMSRMTHESVGAETILSKTGWGQAWIIQVAAAVVILAVSFRRGASGVWFAAAIAALVMAATPALSGHAAASPRWSTLAIGTDALHVIAAAGWLGSLLFVIAVGVPALVRVGAESRWIAIASLVEAFSPVALTFAAVVLLTGTVSAWLRVGSIPALWSSSYGRTLLVKLSLLTGVVATGAYNWRRVRPSLGTESATMRLRKSAAIELTIGALVVVVTALLVATPTPADLP